MIVELTSSEHLRETRDILHRKHRNAGSAERSGSATCGNDFNATGRECRGELGDASLVGNTDQCSHGDFDCSLEMMERRAYFDESGYVEHRLRTAAFMHQT